MAERSAALRQFLFERVYRHYRVHRMWIKAKRVVTELYRSLEAEPGQLPPEPGTHSSSPRRLRNDRRHPAGSSAAGPPLSASRAVCDYLAGLSDREALHEHARLFDPFVSP
jgi:dGTPase